MANKPFEKVKTDLEINEHLDAHRTGFVVQRIGLAFIIAFVVVAASGLFGDGVLSKRKEMKGEVVLHHERFYRYEARMEVKIEIVDATKGSVVSFPNRYLKNFKVEGITPSPNTTKIDDDKVHYFFDGSGNIQLTFYLVPQAFGTINGNIEVNGHPFAVNHFIYP